MYYLGHIVLDSRTVYGSNSKNVTYYRFVPHKQKITQTAIIPYKTKSKNEKDNVYVVAVINKEQSNTTVMTLVHIIGIVGNPAAEYTYLLHKHQLISYTKKLRCQPRNYFESILEQELKRRETTTNNAFTIDPQNSKDYDDAFSVTKIQEDNIIIGVHIADVSFLVQEDTELDKIASSALTTVYPNPEYNQPINMLPNFLCDDLLSLKEGNERIVGSVYFHYKKLEEWCLINQEHKREKTFITKNYSYEEAQKKIKKDENIRVLSSISNENDTHKLVEYWMVKTNEYVAKLLLKQNKSCILRVQEEPTYKDEYTCLSENDKDFYKKLSSKRAYYATSTNQVTSHYSLNTQYTHFTSPLRRYADILVHRTLFKHQVQNQDEYCTFLNDKNKKCLKLLRDEEKLKLVYELEEYWSNHESSYTTGAIVMGKEEEKLYVKIEYKGKNFLLYTTGTSNLFENVVLHITPNVRASYYAKKLLIAQ